MVHLERIKSSSVVIQKFDFQQEKGDNWWLQSIEQVEYSPGQERRIMSTFFQKLVRTIKCEQFLKLSIFFQFNISTYIFEDLSVCQTNR